jgi:hypothetical protein
MSLIKVQSGLERWFLKKIDHPESWQKELLGLDRSLLDYPGLVKRSLVTRLIFCQYSQESWIAFEVSGPRADVLSPLSLWDFSGLELLMTKARPLYAGLSLEKLVEEKELILLQAGLKPSIWGIDFRRRLEEDHQLRLEYVLIFFPSEITRNSWKT